MNCEHRCDICSPTTDEEIVRFISKAAEDQLPDYAGMWVVIEGDEILEAADELADLVIWDSGGGLLMFVPPKNTVMI